MNALPYCTHHTAYQRRKTREVAIGNVIVGGNQPIRVQSMTTTLTRDVEATAQQALDMYEAGCEIVRVTAPNLRDAEAIGPIKAWLKQRGSDVPIVADIHFAPKIAMAVAEFADKVRINPGNFADDKRFAVKEYTDEEYAAELARIEKIFTPLVLKCKDREISMRIGTNHGSLSDRILNRYGDTPRGMVESSLEFIRICQAHDYHDLIISMKASNPLVMIQAYRLLAADMTALGMDYPFHLGVTEAGGGEDGRIKSAAGIGALLEDGIGDTIRVSLTEHPVAEIPVARALASYYDEKAKASTAAATPRSEVLNLSHDFSPYQYTRRRADAVPLGDLWSLGSEHTVRVGTRMPTLSPASVDTLKSFASQLVSREDEGAPEFVWIPVERPEDVKLLQPVINTWRQHGIQTPVVAEIATHSVDDVLRALPRVDGIAYAPSRSLTRTQWDDDVQRATQAAAQHRTPLFWTLSPDQLPNFLEVTSAESQAALLVHLAETAKNLGAVCCLAIEHADVVYAYRHLSAQLQAAGLACPIILTTPAFRATSQTPDNRTLRTAVELGTILCDGIGDAVLLPAVPTPRDAARIAFNILQVTRLRLIRTEFISCPSCGRTLFDLETTTARIQTKTGHLKGIKIAIMGCIVNGPGEMADADFGYVGWGKNKINLFVGKECVEQNVPMDQADERLIELIKAQGKWTNPPLIQEATTDSSKDSSSVKRYK